MLKKVGNALLDIVFLVIIILAIILIMLSVNTSNGVASLFEYMPFSIQSNYMEPVINKGDLIIVQKVDSDNIKEGDIVLFFVLEDDVNVVKIQRIVEVNNSGDIISYITDLDGLEVSYDNVIGKYNNIKISGLGSVYDYLNSKSGFLICIIIPLFIFFGYQVYRFIIVLKKKN